MAYRYIIVLTTAGVPLTGHPGAGNWGVTVRNIDGTVYGGPAIVPAELNAGTAPGVYYFDIASLTKDAVVYIDADALGALGIPAAERYLHIRMSPEDEGIAFSVWSADPLNFSAPASFGFDFRILMGTAAHKNMRIKPVAFDRGRMTECQLVVYPTQADADADTNAIATLDQVSVLSASAPPQLTSFKVTE